MDLLSSLFLANFKNECHIFSYQIVFILEIYYKNDWTSVGALDSFLGAARM